MVAGSLLARATARGQSWGGEWVIGATAGVMSGWGSNLEFGAIARVMTGWDGDWAIGAICAVQQGWCQAGVATGPAGG